MLTSLLIALCVTAEPPSTSAMKNALKDAIDAPEKKDGPDVSRLPFTSDSIKQVVLSYQPKIQACYEDHLATQKKAPEGSIKTSFIITPDGFVKGAKVNKKASSLKDAGLHDCVLAVLSTMAFPKPPDGQDHPIEFPFNLKAVH